MLCLPPIPQGYDLSTPYEVYSSVAVLHKKACEPAGRSYQQYCRQVTGKPETKSEEAIETKSVESEEKDNTKENMQIGNSEENLYEVLGIGDIGIDATPVQIKKAYQRVALVYHPDKQHQSGESEDEVNKRWLLIQKAWETLSNKQKKRQYDSNFEFDDWIPYGNEDFDTPEDFFELYCPVFERNARFATKKNVPHLGDMDTDLKTVHKFYSFWNRFESWREFAHADEYNDIDLKNAECREEKRWMMRRNEAARKKLKKKEYERLADLVSRAFNCDPRLVREREQNRKDKEEKIRQRLAQAQQAKEQEKQVEEAKEEENKVKAEQKAAEQKAKKEKQAIKKRFKRRKKQLLNLCTLALECLDVDPKEKVEYYAAVSDVSEEAKVEADLETYFEAFGDLNQDNSSTPEGKTFATNGLSLLKD